MQNAGRENPYLYNGKELNAVAQRRSRQACGKEFGLNWLSYGAREYDPSIGRWMAVDLLAEKYYSMSPYNYVANNPLIYVDPFGMDLYLANNESLSQAIADIMDLVNSAKFKGSVSFNFTKTENGTKVDTDFDDLPNETIKNNAGLSLLNEVTSSSKNFLYEVGNVVNTRDRKSLKPNGKIDLGTPDRDYGSGDIFKGQIGRAALNISTTDRDEPHLMGLANTDWDKINGLPMNPFFDAHIVVSKYAGDAREKAGGRKISRTWFAFHELQEAYYRTHGDGMGYQNAHDKANKKGINFYRTRPNWDQSVFYPYQKFKRVPSKN